MRTSIVTRLALALIVATSIVPARSGAADADGPRPRIISLYAAHTEVLLRLGARDNIVGHSRQETYDGPETEGWEVPAFSFRDDVEEFLAMQPDIVLARPQHVAGGARMREALEQAGIVVYAKQVARADELYEYWRWLGGLVGREKEAEAMIAQFDAAVRGYREESAKTPDKPGVFLESVHREVKTFTPDSLPVWVVETAGGRNVAGDARPAMPGVVIADFGPERLLEKADDIDIFISQQGVMNRSSREDIAQRNIYQPIKAVREGKIFKIPEAELSRPTPSLLEGLRRVRSIVLSEVP